jgi:hypothetical protein
MTHLSEEQVVLHCFGDADDPGEVARHLEECLECQSEFARVQRFLRQIEPEEVPEPPAIFEEKTWFDLRERLGAKGGGFRRWLLSPPRWAIAGAVAVLVVAAFLAGRYGRRDSGPVENNANTVNPQRVVLVAVGDHLERSQMLLVEIMNSDAAASDLRSAQKQARDLLDANHLYRVSAQQTGDPQIARLLDELGRVLTEIADSPPDSSAADLEEIRSRIRSEGLLFKVRVVGSEVNSRVRRQQISGGNVSQRL